MSVFSVWSPEPVREWRLERCNMHMWLSKRVLRTQMWKYANSMYFVFIVRVILPPLRRICGCVAIVVKSYDITINVWARAAALYRKYISRWYQLKLEKFTHPFRPSLANFYMSNKSAKLGLGFRSQSPWMRPGFEMKRRIRNLVLGAPVIGSCSSKIWYSAVH